MDATPIMDPIPLAPPRRPAPPGRGRRSAVPLVLNRRAGGALALDDARLSALARARGRATGRGVSLHAVDPEGLEARIEDLVRSGPDRILVAGGDGTLSTAASRLAGTGVALGALPLGTCNLFARQLGVPEDPEAAVATLVDAGVSEVDVGEVNGRCFLNAVTLGLFGLAARKREGRRSESDDSRWLPLLRDFPEILREAPVQRLHLVTRRRRRRLHTPFLFVGNNRFEPSLFRLGRRSSLRGGELSLLVARRLDLLRVASILGCYLRGRLGESRWLTERRARSLEIESDEPRLEATIDGDLVELATPLRFRIRPGALRVLRPSSDVSPGSPV